MLTARQSKLLRFIDDEIKRTDGRSPSFEEMRDALGLKSKSGVHRMVQGLEERGFIRQRHNRARAIEVIRRPGAIAPADTSPQLLAALREWLGLHERGALPHSIGTARCLEVTRAAIAAATGEG